MGKGNVSGHAEPNPKQEDFLEFFLNKSLQITQPASVIRKVFFGLGVVTVWVLIAIIFFNIDTPAPLRIGAEFILKRPFLMVAIDYARIMFSPNTIVVMLLILSAYRLALHLCGAFFAEAFGLSYRASVKKDISKWSFSTKPSQVIEIKNGELLPASSHKAIRDRGGPAWIKLDAGNAVVLEKKDGEVAIAAPQFDAVLDLQGFERVRTIFDLRDYATTIHISSRSKEGIPIVIRDMKILVSPAFRSQLSLYSSHSPGLDPIYWLTYAAENVPWQIFIIDLIVRELTLFLHDVQIDQFYHSPTAEHINPKLSEFKRLNAKMPSSKPFRSIHFGTHMNIKPRLSASSHPSVEQLISYAMWKTNKRIKDLKQKNLKGQIQLPATLIELFRENLQTKIAPFQIAIDWTDSGEVLLPPRYLREDYFEISEFNQLNRKLENQNYSMDYISFQKSECIKEKIKTIFDTISFSGSHAKHDPNTSLDPLYEFYRKEIQKGMRACEIKFNKVPKRLQKAYELLTGQTY